MGAYEEHLFARLIRAESALRVIQNWELPNGPEGQSGHHFGSNFERDYMRDVARLGLGQETPTVKLYGKYTCESDAVAALRQRLAEK